MVGTSDLERPELEDGGPHFQLILDLVVPQDPEEQLETRTSSFICPSAPEAEEAGAGHGAQWSLRETQVLVLNGQGSSQDEQVWTEDSPDDTRVDTWGPLILDPGEEAESAQPQQQAANVFFRLQETREDTFVSHVSPGDTSQ